MTGLELVADWLSDLFADDLEGGMRKLETWARDLSRLERELVRMVAIPVAGDYIPLGIVGEMHKTARRLVKAALRLP